MCKENALFIGSNILMLIISAVLSIWMFPGMFGKTGVPFFFACAFGIAGNLISLILLMKKNAPKLKKYNAPFFVSIVISVLYYGVFIWEVCNTKITHPDEILFVIIIPVIVWVLILSFEVKGFKERIIVIFSSPMIYFVFFCMMFLLSMSMDALKLL